MKGTRYLLHFLVSLITVFVVNSTKFGDGTASDQPSGRGPSNETLGELLNRMQDYQNVLIQAAQDVTGLHRPPRSSNDQGSVPRMDVGSDFMRSFTPNSGIGNRDEVVMEDMREVELISDLLGVVQWTYIRFNNSDCLMARLERHVIVWKLQISQHLSFQLGFQNAFSVIETEYGSIDSIFYTRTSGYDRELYVAVLSDNRVAPTIHVYEMRHSKLIPVTFLHLEERPVKIGFVESYRGSAIAMLIPKQGKTEVVPKQTGHDHQNIIKIYTQYPIDLVTFSMNGIGYIALANDTYCEIFRFDEYLQDYSLFDRMYVRDIVDLEIFHLGFERFLVIVGAFEQHLLVWREGGFIPRQLLTAPNVARMHATYMGGCRDDVLLTALGGSRHVPLRLYLLRENEFIPLVDHGLASIFSSFQSIVGSLESFTDNRTVFLLTTDQLSMRSRLFAIKTALISIPDPVIIKGAKATDVMKEFEIKLHEQERQLRFFHEKLEKAVRPENNVITARQVLNNLNAIQNTGAAILNRLGPITWQGSGLTLADLRWPIDDLERAVMDLEKQLENLEQLLTDVAMRDRDETLTGHKTIHGPVVANQMSFTTLDLPRVGDIDVRRLLSDVFRLDRPRPIGGRVIFKGDFRTRRNMDVDRLNSIDVGRDVALTTKPQQIQGAITFASPLMVDGDLEIEGTVNGLDLSRDVVTLHGSHYIPSYKNFSVLHVEESLTSQFVDNVDLPKLVEMALTKNKEQIVHFDPLRVFRGRIGDLTVDGQINGHFPQELANGLVRIDRPSVINGLKHIRHPIFEGGLFVDGLYDHLRIPEDLMLNGPAQTIVAPKHFRNVVVKDAVIGGTVDGLKLPDDVVTLTGDEAVPAMVFANGMDVENDLEVGRFVNEMDMRALNDMVKSEPRSRPNVVFVGPTIVRGTLRVENFGGVDLMALSKDLVFPGEELVEFTGHKEFVDEATVASAVVRGSVNGYNLAEDFVNVHTDQIVRGRKTFLRGVEFGSNLVAGKNMIGDMDIVHLFQNHISLSGPSVINTKLTLVDELTVEHDFGVKGTIDGLVLPGNAVLRERDQVIGPKRFLNGLSVQDLSIDGDLLVASTLDGVDIDDFIRRRVTLSMDQTLPGHYLASDLTASMVETNLLNNVDLVEFSGKVMSVTRPQIIPVEFAFPGTTNVFGSMITTKGVNGIRLDHVNLKAVKLHGHVVLPSSVTFASPLTVEGDTLVRNGLVNGIDLVGLNTNAVKKIGEFWMTGRNVLTAPTQVRGDVDADTINGVKLPLVILLKHGDQTITGYHHFGDVTIAGDMNNLQLVNGLDLSTMQHLIVRNDRPANITGSLTFVQPLHVIGHLHTEGTINGVKVSQLPYDAVQKWGEQTIGGRKEILGPVQITGDLQVDFINGINIPDFLKDVVYTTGHQEISASKTFLSPLEIASNAGVEGQLMVGGLLDGVDLKQFEQGAVFLHQPAVVTGRKQFAETTVLLGSLLVKGKVNGLNLRDAVHLHTNEPQVIGGVKTFRNVFSSSPIEVLGQVNGNNLPTLFEDTVMSGRDQVVTGHKVFKGRVNFVAPVSSPKVNGMKIEQELVPLHGDRELSGEFNFDGIVDVAGNLEISGLINGVDLRRLAADALYKIGPQTITGQYQLGDTVVESKMDLKGTLNGVPVSRLGKDVDEYERAIVEEEHRLKGRMDENQNVAGYLDSVLRRSLYTLDYFTLHQVLKNFTGSLLQKGSDVFIKSGKSLLKFYWGKGGELVFDTAVPIPADSQVFLFNGSPHVAHRMDAGTSILSRNEETFATLPPADAMAFLSLGERLLVVIGTSDFCRMYVFRKQGIAEEIGVVPVGTRIESLAAFTVRDQVYIAVGTSGLTNCLTGVTHIYLWRENSFPLVQTMEGVVQEVIPFTRSGWEYVLVALTDNKHVSTIQLMRNCDCCESGMLEVAQTLPVEGLVDMELFEVGNSEELYLGMANRTHVQINLLAGVSGFQPHSILSATDVTSVRSFVFGNDLHLVVGQGSGSEGALVYLAVMKGSKVEMLYRRWS